jgi:hypothetical protein
VTARENSQFQRGKGSHKVTTPWRGVGKGKGHQKRCSIENLKDWNEKKKRKMRPLTERIGFFKSMKRPKGILSCSYLDRVSDGRPLLGPATTRPPLQPCPLNQTSHCHLKASQPTRPYSGCHGNGSIRSSRSQLC